MKRQWIVLVIHTDVYLYCRRVLVGGGARWKGGDASGCEALPSAAAVSFMLHQGVHGEVGVFTY